MPDSLPRYDHPLDLLLDLLRQHQVPLTDISLAPITAQYLDYMHRAAQLDINLGVEFVHTASLLIYLKSKALLPDDPTVAPRVRDPDADFLRQLLTRADARQAAELLWQKKLEEDAFHGPSIKSPSHDGTFSLWDLLREFHSLAQQDWNPPPVYVPEDQGPDVSDMLEWLQQRLPRSSVSLTELLSEQPSRKHQAALFLAVLEAARNGDLRLNQPSPFSSIWIEPAYSSRY